jgi:hypothetical protein
LKYFVFLIFLLLFNPVLAADYPGDEPPQNYFKGFKRESFQPGGAEKPEIGKPIIWILIDALRPDHLGAYGYQRDTSPTLDGFADEGVIFTRFFANSPWTRTATATMLSGRIPYAARGPMRRPQAAS